MKQQFALQPYSCNGKSGYRAKFVNRSGEARSFEEIVASAAKGAMLDNYGLSYAFKRVMDEAIQGALKTGEIQHLGDYGTLVMNIHGTFDGLDDQFDPELHSIDFRFFPGPRLKGQAPQFVVENVVKSNKLVIYEIGPAEMTSVGASLSRYMVRGKKTLVNIGNGPLLAGDKVSWVVTTTDGEIATGEFELLDNECSRLILQWPTDLPSDLKKREVTLVFKHHGEDGLANQTRKVTVPLFFC